MSWRPTRNAPRKPRNFKLLVIIAVLLAVNAAVILYHGDPRAFLQRAAQPAAAPAAQAAPGPTAPRSDATPADASAPVDASMPGDAPAGEALALMGPPLPLDPLAGMRAPG